MGRIRTIKPETPESESLGRVSREARLCFLLLFTQADDEGRMRGNAQMLAGRLFPYDEDAKGLMEGWLGALEGEGCIQRYIVDGKAYLQIVEWKKHQKVDKPTPSRFPAPPESPGRDPEFVESSPSAPRGLHEDSANPPRVLPEASCEDMDLGSRILDQDPPQPPKGGVVPFGGAEVEEVLAEWNAMAQAVGLPTTRGGASVRDKIRTRLKDPKWHQDFRGLLRYTRTADWTKGGNERGWKADIEWALRRGQAERYAEQVPLPQARKQPLQQGPVEAWAALLEKAAPPSSPGYLEWFDSLSAARRKAAEFLEAGLSPKLIAAMDANLRKALEASGLRPSTLAWDRAWRVRRDHLVILAGGHGRLLPEEDLEFLRAILPTEQPPVLALVR